MAWVKVEHETVDKPEVIAIADLLGLDQDAVVGKLIRLWVWADQQTITGCARSVTKMFVDRKTRVTGFADAMLRVGWLRVTSGGLQFPNFDRHNGETAKNRALSLKRMQKLRYASGVTSALPREREEKDKKKDNTPLPPLPDSGVPSGLDTPKFRAAWTAWLGHRREIKKPLKPTAAAAKLRQLAAWGPERAVAAIEHSMGNGWQGIFEPDGKAGGTPAYSLRDDPVFGLTEAEKREIENESA